jgi:hypothetical protein
MCRRVQCSRCGRPTFAGCGAHVEQVLGDVPRDQRCRCREERREERREEGRAEGGQVPTGGKGWLRGLFGGDGSR